MNRRSFFTAAASAMAFLAAGPKAWGKAWRKPKMVSVCPSADMVVGMGMTSNRFNVPAPWTVEQVKFYQFAEIERDFWTVPTETTEPMAYWLHGRED